MPRWLFLRTRERDGSFTTLAIQPDLELFAVEFAAERLRLPSKHCLERDRVPRHFPVRDRSGLPLARNRAGEGLVGDFQVQNHLHAVSCGALPFARNRTLRVRGGEEDDAERPDCEAVQQPGWDAVLITHAHLYGPVRPGVQKKTSLPCWGALSVFAPHYPMLSGHRAVSGSKHEETNILKGKLFQCSARSFEACFNVGAVNNTHIHRGDTAAPVYQVRNGECGNRIALSDLVVPHRMGDNYKG